MALQPMHAPPSALPIDRLVGEGGDRGWFDVVEERAGQPARLGESVARAFDAGHVAEATDTAGYVTLVLR